MTYGPHPPVTRRWAFNPETSRTAKRKTPSGRPPPDRSTNRPARLWAKGAPPVAAVAVRAGAVGRYRQEVPLHAGCSDPAFLNTIPGLALVA